ncbi:MAG: type I-F CRISPR-associated protein Csy1 [Sphingobacteriaceae bacterium]|nr:type I-F CRISPR-associated protein Csy1 [Sphingobacteriaceae bacterium]
MSEGQSILQSWESVISDFFLQKRNLEEEKYIKEALKNFYSNNQSLMNHFENEKLKRNKEEEPIDFQRRILQGLFIIKNGLSANDKEVFDAMSSLSNEYAKEVEKIIKKYDPEFWISEASKNAASVSFATHVSKLTHSKIDTPSIYDQVEIINSSYVTTSSLRVKAIDGAVAGNQFAPVFQFLELECNGVKLAAELANENSQALRKFSDDNYLDWNKGFSNALRSDELASHILAKQVYFPIIKLSGNTDNYHLLSIMKSSSLAHAIFEKSAVKEFNDRQRKIRDDFERKEKFSKIEAVYFSGKGKISVTASNHSNASQLNGKRGGRLHLFLSAPPIWQSQLKPPVYKKSFFDTQLRYHVSKDDIDYLRDFLIRFDKIELSIKHPKRKQWINDWVGRIIDSTLDSATIIQDIESGWTANNDIKLKREHQLFLDPYRDDELFQAERKHNVWQAVVCTDFARWLNLVLVGKDKKFSPQPDHTRMWLELMESALREFDELVAMDVKAAKVIE